MHDIADGELILQYSVADQNNLRDELLHQLNQK